MECPGGAWNMKKATVQKLRKKTANLDFTRDQTLLYKGSCNRIDI